MYVGRFAPTPSGPLHFGSLLAALASYLDARANNGKWLVRIDDLDTPRCPPGCADDILRTLEAFGFEWDGEVIYQSKRSEAYRAALNTLEQKGMVYSCTCSRKDIQAASMAGHAHGVYPQICRPKVGTSTNPSGKIKKSLRLKSETGSIEFVDRIQGAQRFSVEDEIGDFVLFRADGFFAYHLAVTVDDDTQGVSHIVRGADLLSSTAHHLHVQRQLGFRSPQYAHIPVIANAQGEKLSKQTLAPALKTENTLIDLQKALCFLGQQSMPAAASVAELLEYAVSHWKIDDVPKKTCQREAV